MLGIIAAIGAKHAAFGINMTGDDGTMQVKWDLGGSQGILGIRFLFPF